MLFSRTLTEAVQDWYLFIEPYVVQDWDGLHRAFIEKYIYNKFLKITIRDLKKTRQEPRKTFAEFVSRWGIKASKMLKRPEESEQVDIVIKKSLTRIP